MPDIEWLHLQPEKPFRLQPYQQLAKVLRSSGDEAAAKRVLVAQQNDLRRNGKLGPLQKLLNLFLGVTIQHGYAPHRAFVGMLAFILLGSGVFYWADKNHLMSEVEEHDKISEVDYPKFDAFLYSLDTFLPIIDLRLKGYWLPNANKDVTNAKVADSERGGSVSGVWSSKFHAGDMVRAYLTIHMIFGWILTTLWVAGFTGLVRSRD